MTDRQVTNHTTRWSGRVGRAISTGSLRVIETFHPPGSRVPRHQHDHPFATIVVHGEYVEKRGSGNLTVSAGSVAMHGESDRHSDYFGSQPAHLLSIEWLSGPSRSPGSKTIPPERAISRICRDLLSELEEHDSLSQLSIESLAAEIAVLSESSRTPDPESDDWIRRLEERLRDEFRQSLSLSVLAEDLGVHRSHLARAFRLRFGCTIGQYMRSLRVAWARERLVTGGAISDVAVEAGFSDQSHMTRWFQRLIGITPGDVTRN